jgi:acyl-CoA thioester hydrolase
MSLTAFVLPVRVYYEDTDASGVAYHANYLRWFERGRTEWLRSRGYGQEDLRLREGIAFTLASLQIDYLKPARLDDLLDVVTRIGELKRASVVFEQWLQRAGSDQVLARLTARAACVDAATFRPKPLPPGFSGV